MCVLMVLFCFKFGKVSTTSLSSTDAETREQLIKDHFSKRLNELTLQLQVADSKAVCFHAEVRERYWDQSFMFCF